MHQSHRHTRAITAAALPPTRHIPFDAAAYLALPLAERAARWMAWTAHQRDRAAAALWPDLSAAERTTCVGEATCRARCIALAAAQVAQWTTASRLGRIRMVAAAYPAATYAERLELVARVTASVARQLAVLDGGAK